MNKLKTIIGIVSASSIALVILFMTQIPVLSDNIPEQTNDYFVIVDYNVENKITMNVLSITVSDKIPQNLAEFELDENTLGFGYTWFWEDVDVSGHLGPGHAKGYLATIHKGDPFGDSWHMEYATVEVLNLEEYGFDFCLSDIEGAGSITINENMIIANTRLGTHELPELDLIQVFSFNLIQNSICHSGFGGEIIHVF